MNPPQPLSVVRVIGLCVLPALVAGAALARDSSKARNVGLPHAPAAAAPSSSVFTHVRTVEATPSGTNELLGSDSSVFTSLQTVQVTWDDHFEDDSVPDVGSGNIFHVPATGNLVVMVKLFQPTPLVLPPLTESENPGLDTCPMAIVGYREYTPNMQPTGEYGYLFCAIGDWNSLIVGNEMYLVKAWNSGPGTADFWRLYKFDAVTWEKLGTVDIPLDSTQEWSDGPTMSVINGMITVSGELLPGGTADGPLGRGSHHHFVTTDLRLMGKQILVSPDVPSHCPESSLRQLENGDILVFSGSTYFGDLVAMRLDRDWNFLDEHTLRRDAFFPLGAVAYGGYWIVTYYDISKKPAGAPWPVGDPPIRNVGLAAVDASWNLTQDEMLTDFPFAPVSEERFEGETSWVELLAGHLYVTYAVTKFKAGSGGAGSILDTETHVNVYELNQAPTTCTSFTIFPTTASPSASAGSQHVALTGSPSGCTDGSWTASGNGSWLTVLPSSGTGAGYVTVSWEANTGASERTGTATIAGQTFEATQAAPPCTFVIVPTAASVAASGGVGSIMVTTSRALCDWVATSSAPEWLAITSGASGTGSGAVAYAVADNPGDPRSATITVAGEIFTVTQDRHGQAVHRRLTGRRQP